MHISGSDPQSRADSAFGIKDLEKQQKHVDCPKKTENMNKNNILLKKVEKYGSTTFRGYRSKWFSSQREFRNWSLEWLFIDENQE